MRVCACLLKGHAIGPVCSIALSATSAAVIREWERFLLQVKLGVLAVIKSDDPVLDPIG